MAEYGKYGLCYNAAHYSPLKAMTHKAMEKEAIERCKHACISAFIVDAETIRVIGRIKWINQRWKFVKEKSIKS